MDFDNDEMAEYLFEKVGDGLLPLLNNNGLVFFKPDMTFIDWIIKQAGGRMIMEVGSGTAHVLHLITARGHNRIIGIEPCWDVTSSIARNPAGEMMHILPYDVTRARKMIEAITAAKTKEVVGTLLLICRPAHTGYTEEAIDYAAPGTVVMYITKKNNLDEYDDLGKYTHLGEIVKHEGTSADNEVVVVFTKP